MATVHRYYAYLLRIWSEGSGDAMVWRITLEIPKTHQVMSFNSLSSLTAYLEEKISHHPGVDVKKNG